jgi:UDP-GlcNAc:undecaprenyl-phosphate GlcNAc-1-phosphate transferase
MSVTVALLVGFLASRLVWLTLRPVFEHPLFLRTNFRGRSVPTAAGVVVAVAVVVVEAARVALGSDLTGARTGVLVLAAGLCLLGLVDDLAGGEEHRGFRGHVGALAGGHLTTGALKLVGGAAVALVAVAAVRPGSGVLERLTDAALVGLAANLGNLFDLAPGRATKAGALSFAALALATQLDGSLVSVAVAVGAALGLLVDDLRERLMLGDSGANVVGGAIGLGVVAACSPVARLAVLGVVLVLNGMSERVSFSRVIERVAPLRAFDRAGRRP